MSEPVREWKAIAYSRVWLTEATALRRSLHVIHLPSWSTLLGEITCIENLRFDPLLSQTTTGGVEGPSHVRSVKIATVDGISVKLPELPHPTDIDKWIARMPPYQK